MNETPPAPANSVPSTLPDFKQGDHVRVKGTARGIKNPYKGQIGTIEHIGRSTGLLIDSVPLYFVTLPSGLFVYLGEELEPVAALNKGDFVKVTVRSLFTGQICPVLHIEHNTEHYRRFAETWYLLDTRYPGQPWGRPTYFERHELERVTPESEAQHE